MPDSTAESHQNDEEIRRRELRLRLLTDALPLLISYVDKDQRYQFNNRAYENWFGHSQEETKGRHVKDVLGSEAYQVLLPHVENALAGNTIDYEARVPYKDGGERYIHATYVPDIDRNGSIEGFFVLVEDITARKQAELVLAEKSVLLETTFETMSQGIAVFDADLRLTAFNQRYLDLRDYPKGYISLGMTYEQIARFNAERGDYGPGDSEKQVKERLKAARQGKPWRREYTKAEGTALAVGFDSIPGSGFVATITDITERKRAEDALQKAHDVLESKVMERT